MKNIKLILVVISLSITPITAMAQNINNGLVGRAIEAVESIANNIVDNFENTTTIQNSDIKNDTTNNQAAVLGNSGIEVTGDDIELKNSRIKNVTRNNQALVVGNSGVKIGD